MKTIHVTAAIMKSTGPSGTPVIFATQRGYGPWKDFWEFPGGKVEAGETPEDALRREIREELDTEIAVGSKLMTVEYDYPEFHLSMDCFWCTIEEGHLRLLEHEAARWLRKDQLHEVNWLPADHVLIQEIEKAMKEHSEESGAPDTENGARLLSIWHLKDLDFPKLMEIYRESNTENVPDFFPDETDLERGRKRVELEFLKYLEEFFREDGNCYYVLADKESWLSAIRLYPVPGKDRAWYAEALETRPDRRREGFGRELFRQLFLELSSAGGFEITDSVSKRNEASLKLHLSCGFEIFQESAVSALSGNENPKAYGLRYRWSPELQEADPDDREVHSH